MNHFVIFFFLDFDLDICFNSFLAGVGEEALEL